MSALLLLVLHTTLPVLDEAKVDAWAQRVSARCRTPGLAVAVVLGDQTLAKGYGLADVESKRPVDAEHTRFALASVTKTVTAAAVLQAVREGKLELHTELDRTVQGVALPASVTLHQLLTHTSGLDDSLIGAAARSPAALQPLSTFLAAHPPVSIARPGALWSYSNRNYSLAGLALEQASGEPFARYVQRHLLAPLGLEHSGFGPASDGDTLATVYDVSPEGTTPAPWPWTNDVPAGGMNATASDMLRLLQALLGGAGLDGSVRAGLLDVQYRFHEQLPGMTYGLMEAEHAGHVALMHEGNMGPVAALLYLVPELKLGVFAAVNGGGEECDLVGLPHALIDAPEHHGVAAGSFVQPEASLRALEGTYRTTRYPHATFEKVGVVLGLVREVEVRVQPDGTLGVGRGRYRGVGDGVFRQVDGEGRVAFRDGQLSNGAATTYVRVPWYAALTLHRVAMVACLMVLLITAIGGTVAAIWRFVRRREAALPLVRRVRLTSVLLAVGSLAFVGGLAAPFFGPMGPSWLLYGVPVTVQAVLLLPYALAALASATIWWAVATWRRRAGSLFGRIGYSLAGLTGVTFITWLSYWHLVGPA